MVGFTPSLLHAADGDLRQQYGTRSMECAKHIDATIHLSQDKKSDEALKEIQLATKEDPNCAMAWLWTALVNEDLGDIDASIDAYQHCVTLDVNPQGRSVTTTAIEYLAARLRDQPHLGEALDFLVRILCRMNLAPAPENAVIFIWFC